MTAHEKAIQVTFEYLLRNFDSAPFSELSLDKSQPEEMRVYCIVLGMLRKWHGTTDAKTGESREGKALAINYYQVDLGCKVSGMINHRLSFEAVQRTFARGTGYLDSWKKSGLLQVWGVKAKKGKGPVLVNLPSVEYASGSQVDYDEIDF